MRKSLVLVTLVLSGILLVASACGQGQSAGTGPKVVEMEAYQYGWTPETITLKKGQKVRLSISSTAEADPGFPMHSFALDEYNITQNLPVGETTTVEFVADKSGVFTFYCSIYCGSGHDDMKGTLKVE